MTDWEEIQGMTKKKWMYYSGVGVMVTILSFGFKSFTKGSTTEASVTNKQDMVHSFPAEEVAENVNFRIPFTGKTFTGFKEAIGFKESQCRYKMINSLGYMGKYQFGLQALKAVGINNTAAFLNNPKLQEIAFRVLLSKNKSQLKEEIKKYEGKIIKGIKITESGLLAAAHLGGAGSVRKFLRSNGESTIKDGYGTSVRSYIKAFGGYDTSSIEMDRNAKVCMN